MERWTALLPDRANGGPTRSTTGPRLPPPPRLLGRLPAEAYLTILAHLPIPDIPQFARCSRACARLARDDRLWRRKLEWLDYYGPGQVDWRAPQPRLSNDLVQSPATTTTTPHPFKTARSQQPDRQTPAHKQSLLATTDDDDDFGDFFAAEPDHAAGAGGPEEDEFGDFNGDAQGFSDFQAFGDSPEQHGDGFGGLSGQMSGLEVGGVRRSVDQGAEDLMMMFDDDNTNPIPKTPPPPHNPPTVKPALGLDTAARPPPLAQLTFDHTPPPASPQFATNSSLLAIFRLYHSQLIPYYTSLLSHTTSSLVFTQSTLTPRLRAFLLATLARFIEPEVAPTRSLPQRLTAKRNIGAAADFFEAALLAEFSRADERNDEDEMKEKVEILIELNGGLSAVQVFVQKREMLTDAGFDPLQNLTKVLSVSGDLVGGIDFSAMDVYIQSLIALIAKEGGRVARVFPPALDALVYFLDRLCTDVVSEYISTLLDSAQELDNPLFLLATAATFGQVHRLVPAVLQVEPLGKLVTQNRVEDVIWRLFEPHMDDYLTEEGEWVRTVLEGMCTDWDEKVASEMAVSDPTFLASANPAQVKKNVLAGFTSALLLPVTIIPKTAAFGLGVLTTGATGAYNTFSQFGTTLGTTLTRGGASSPGTPVLKEAILDSAPAAPVVVLPPAEAGWGDNLSPEVNLRPPSPTPSVTPSLTPSATGRGRFDRLQLLLSLDVALQLIQADRDCLKRVQTFAKYPGAYGKKVRDALEEVFIVLLQTLGEKHVGPAFARATKEMGEWRPEEGGGREGEVAPLVQFFELVHVGDTIGQMVHVYWEKEMAAYIDPRDFLNVVVREKKKFEHLLDDSVAVGLNAGVNLLMVQVEHLLQHNQGPRDFAPPDDFELELRPTETCKQVIDVLKTHCDMLKGSTDKQILEVFHQEVGIRLHGIVLKHLKRLIVSLSGGFQLISDLNSYHGFISGLRQPTVTAYFSSLKMVGEIYIVEDPKDLGQLVRDVARYEGTLSADDLYELVQRRADWKRIEKQVEKQLFGLKLADDCVLLSPSKRAKVVQELVVALKKLAQAHEEYIATCDWQIQGGVSTT